MSPSQTPGCRIHHGAHAETRSPLVPGASLVLAPGVYGKRATVTALQLRLDGLLLPKDGAFLHFCHSYLLLAAPLSQRRNQKKKKKEEVGN